MYVHVYHMKQTQSLLITQLQIGYFSTNRLALSVIVLPTPYRLHVGKTITITTHNCVFKTDMYKYANNFTQRQCQLEFQHSAFTQGIYNVDKVLKAQ